MREVFFAHNANVVRASFPLANEPGTISLEELRDFGAGYLERLCALIMLAVASPVLGILILLNKLTSSGPAFYTQTRVGKDGAAFPVYKLRTMVVGAEAKTGPVLSWKGDPRVTKLGNFLRKTHLDELPQLVNVARGEMSFIGPRPERPEFVRQYNDDVSGYRLRHKIKPGITGLAQICCGYDATAEEKLTYDLVYLKNKHSLRMLTFILYRTVMKVVLAK